MSFKSNFVYKLPILLLLLIFSLSETAGQSTVIDDNLQGKTKGIKKGGVYKDGGYAPGKGTNHILYNVPKQVTNGYVEFEIKGFNPSAMPKNEDHAFIILYDGRGISEPIAYSNDFKHNYFRWNVHWRQNRSAFKAVIACAANTTSRINSSKAVYKDKNGDGLDSHDRDWYTEPTGSGQSFNSNSWYKIKVQWNKKKFEVFVNGNRKWSASGPYDYNPVDFKIWLGSGPSKYDSDVNVIYRNFKLVDLGGSSGGPTNSLSVSPSSRSVGSSSGSTSFSIDSNVDWKVSESADWFSVSPTSGSGDKNIVVNFEENTNSSGRSKKITITGSGITREVTVSQSGKSGSGGGGGSGDLTVSPTSKSVSNSAGSFNLTINTKGSWRVRDNTDWMKKIPKEGTGNGTCKIEFKANTTGSARTGILTVTVGSKVVEVEVTQGAGSGGGSGGGGSGELAVSPTSKSVNNSAGAFNLTINTKGSWRVRDNTDWMKKIPKTGTGNGTSRIEYKANTTGAPRTGIITVTVGSEVVEVKVTQGSSGGSGGGSGELTVSPTSRSVSNSAGSFNLTIKTNGSWRVRDNTDWMRKIPKTGTGNGTSRIEYKENTTGAQRTGTISVTVGNEVVEIKVTQSASGQIAASSIELPKLSAENFDNTNIVEIEIPESYQLEQNYPNPFNPSTTISFGLPNSDFVKLELYNLLGEKIATLVDREFSSGYHTVNFDANGLSAGTYIYRIQTSNYMQSKKMILLK